MAVIKRIASKATPKKIVSYLTQEEKTEEKLIGGKDCDPDNVVNDFNMTQELYGKTGGVKYHHIIQRARCVFVIQKYVNTTNKFVSRL